VYSGFAFVNFEGKEECGAAQLLLKGIDVNGTELKIDYAVPKAPKLT
jgi:RNA recognition motif-containing protein